MERTEAELRVVQLTLKVGNEEVLFPTDQKKQLARCILV